MLGGVWFWGRVQSANHVHDHSQLTVLCDAGVLLSAMPQSEEDRAGYRQPPWGGAGGRRHGREAFLDKC